MSSNKKGHRGQTFFERNEHNQRDKKTSETHFTVEVQSRK